MNPSTEVVDTFKLLFNIVQDFKIHFEQGMQYKYLLERWRSVIR